MSREYDCGDYMRAVRRSLAKKKSEQFHKENRDTVEISRGEFKAYLLSSKVESVRFADDKLNQKLTRWV